MSRVHLDGSPWLYRLKVATHKVVRRVRWRSQPERYPAKRIAPRSLHPHRIYSDAIPLRRADAAADARLEEGKRVNVALAAEKINDSCIDSNHLFSFWRTVGPIRKKDGYRAGLEIHGGCLVPSVGGGVCLVSNALFEMAVRLGWVVHERHGHTQEAVPPEGPLWSLDATVLYPYVDLRFAPREGAARLRLSVTETHLLVEVFADRPRTGRVELEQVDVPTEAGFRRGHLVRRCFDDRGRLLHVERLAHSHRKILMNAERARTCFTCGETECPSRAGFLAAAS